MVLRIGDKGIRKAFADHHITFYPVGERQSSSNITINTNVTPKLVNAF